MYIALLHITTDDYFISLHFSILLLHITTIRDITTITSYYYTQHYYTILRHYYSLLVNTLSLLNSKFWEKLLLDYFHYYIISITTKHNYYVLLLLLPLLIPPTWRWRAIDVRLHLPLEALELVSGLLHDLHLGHGLADVALPDLECVHEIEVLVIVRVKPATAAAAAAAAVEAAAAAVIAAAAAAEAPAAAAAAVFERLACACRCTDSEDNEVLVLLVALFLVVLRVFVVVVDGILACCWFVWQFVFVGECGLPHRPQPAQEFRQGFGGFAVCGSYPRNCEHIILYSFKHYKIKIIYYYIIFI